MTKFFDDTVETIKTLSSETQDYIAQAMRRLAELDKEEPEEIDPAHLPGILEGLAQADRREFLTDEEVEAVFRRFDS